MRSLIILLFLDACASDGVKHWGYRDTAETYGPAHWKHHHQECGMRSQSPVVLQCHKFDSKGPVKFYTNGPSTEGKITNNGHSLTFSISIGVERPLRMSGGPLNGEFVVEQFHFHWGSKDSIGRGLGSEHRVKGQRSIAEMHVVTFNGKYGSMKEAVQHPDGLSVFGILIHDQLSSSSPLYTDPVNLSYLINAGSSVPIPAVANLTAKLMNILNQNVITRHYYTYSGSLTTPPCSQIVQWIVSKKHQRFPDGMLSELQKLKGSNGAALADNFRPTQNLFGRQITCA